MGRELDGIAGLSNRHTRSDGKYADARHHCMLFLRQFHDIFLFITV
jgi:hypothetical protein